MSQFEPLHAIPIHMTVFLDLSPDFDLLLVQLNVERPVGGGHDVKPCFVFGVPKEAIKLGAVDKSLPLDAIAPYVIKPI